MRREPLAGKKSLAAIQPSGSWWLSKASAKWAVEEHSENTALANSSATPGPHSPLRLPSAVSAVASFGESNSCCGSPRRRRSTSASTSLSRHHSPLKSPEVVPKTRKRFTGEEPLDPKTMTMYDMIWWNPKNDTALKTRENLKKENKEISLDEWQKQEQDRRQAESKEAAKKVAAPQVKIAEDGSLVLDESSLTIVNDQSSSIWETVNEDRIGRRVTSTSFRKRAWRKGIPWSDLETDLFYEILRATGPDFGLMHEFFPSRSRAELKSKFNKEERSNWARLSKAMSSPTVLNDSLFTYANEVLQKIGEESLKKKEQRMTKKERMALHASQQDECEEEDSSVGETAVRIKVIGSDGREPSVKVVEKNTTQGEDTQGTSEQQATVDAVFEEVGAEFPRFKLVEEQSATVVSLERRDDGMPVVRVPVKTVVCAYPRDDTQPERILFDCPATESHPHAQFLLQQRIGPLDPPSGFLHLFGPPK
ncbi:unnamed protein product [Toxocara canis]|uniref:SANT domain-containing protein n=1 Tax=Toxocara canis TaxID=6265 RepID=A0A183UAS2_TOXCA|nr:unnamed protein product [Toxocara canis]